MSNQTQGLDRQLDNYLLSSSLRSPEVLRQLRWQTASHQMAPMQIAPEQVVQLMGAKKTHPSRCFHWLQYPGCGFSIAPRWEDRPL